MTVGIVDYGCGNLISVENVLEKKCHCFVSSDPLELVKAEKIVLPGVGAFSESMKHLKDSGLAHLLSVSYSNGVPILGICLGMQLLFSRGTEGSPCEGLGLISGSVVPLPRGLGRVPHVGWNDVCSSEHGTFKLTRGAKSVQDAYFVHSYHCVVEEEDELETLTTDFYGEKIVVGIEKENLYAVQFHPEKSQNFGALIFDNFLALS